MQPDQSAAPVYRRKAFYIPGFDPLSARRYRELYRVEGAKQAQICGYDLTLSAAKPQSGNYGWQVKMDDNGIQTSTEFEFLGWNDLVRETMRVPIPVYYGWLLRTAWLYARSGALLQLFRLRWAPMLAAMYPVVVLTLYVLLSAGLGWAIVWGAGALGLPILLGLVLGMLGFAGGMILSRRVDPHIFVYYLMADYAFTAAENGRMPKALRDRLAEFVEAVEAAYDGSYDEILIVGHSSGAHIGVQLMAALLRRRPAPPVPLNLMTLGEVVPMVSFLPTSSDLRRDLFEVARAGQVFWLDVTAPGDGGSFALCDPVSVTGVAPLEDEKHNPKVISAKFSHTVDPARLRALRWKFFRKHILYLHAFDTPLDYDYFRITAGAQTLEDRFAWRGSTKSRIERPMSPHRSMD